MFHLRGILRPKPGQLDNFKQALLPMIELAQNTPGILQYDWYHNGDSSEFHVLETYENSETFLTYIPQITPLALKFLEFGDIINAKVFGEMSEAAKEVGKQWGFEFCGPLAGFTRPNNASSTVFALAGVKLKAGQQHSDELNKLIVENVEKGSAGTLVYEFYQEGDTIHIWEELRDAASFPKHIEAASTQLPTVMERYEPGDTTIYGDLPQELKDSFADNPFKPQIFQFWQGVKLGISV